MNRYMKRKRTDHAGLALLVLLGVLWLGPSQTGLGAQDAAASPPPSLTANQTVYLQYRELTYGIGGQAIPFTLQSGPFTREPKLSQRGVCRGTLKFGNHAGHFVAFVWDRPQGKLYLDLNRNQDLTDDPQGVFFNTAQPVNEFLQSFNGVRLSFQTAQGPQPALVDLWFTFYGNQLTNVSASCRYWWEGRLAQPGHEWHLALVDNLSGKIGLSPDGDGLVIRPWAERDQPVSAQYGSSDYFSFFRNLFLGQRAYQWDCALVRQDDHLKYRLLMKEYPEQLGELKIAGQHIRRLVLTREGRFVAPTVQLSPLLALLDQPGSLVKLPLGAYHYQFTVGQGAVEARRLSDRYGPAQRASETLVVNPTNAAILTGGGPLTNSVSVSRSGWSLVLRYQLLGANGEAYELQGAPREREFAIYRTAENGDQQLASGKFELG